MPLLERVSLNISAILILVADLSTIGFQYDLITTVYHLLCCSFSVLCPVAESRCGPDDTSTLSRVPGSDISSCTVCSELNFCKDNTRT
jgi:hypothetical protein